MKVKVNIVDCGICNYDGLCQLSSKNAEDHGYAWCYGDKFGTSACPLLSPVATVEATRDDVPTVEYPIK